MATLTITIVSGLGTTSDAVTFASADAQRILNGYKKISNNASATQQDLTDYIKAETLRSFKQWVTTNEIVVTVPVVPVFT